MKAVVVQSPGVVEVCEVPEPFIGEYDGLCQVVAVSICAGTDRNIVHNHPYHKVQYPFVLGHEGIGRIIALGTKARNFKIGDLVTRVINNIPGWHAQYGALAERALARDWQAMKDDAIDGWQRHTVHRALPPEFDPVEATPIITWRETYAFFSNISPQAGERLLVIGSGANALALANHGKNSGLEVAVIGSPNRKSSFAQVGADAYFSYQSDVLLELKQKELDSFDVIVDAIGRQESLNAVLPLLVSGGRAGIYGLDEGLDFSKVRPDIEYFHPEEYDEGGAHDSVIEHINQDKLKPWHYLSREHVYRLDDIRQALAAAWSGRAIKSVVIP